MRILLKEPGREPRTMVIPNELKVMQDLVGGYIEVIGLNDMVIICNEEGKLQGLEPNLFMENDVIVGPVIFAGTNREDFSSLTDEQLERVMDMIRRCA